MEWAGWIALMVMFFYCTYPKRVRILEGKIKKLERKQEGNKNMSKLINDLIGQSCIIESECALSFVGNSDMKCMILDADDEWVKISYTDKKGVEKTKIIRIDSINTVETY